MANFGEVFGELAGVKGQALLLAAIVTFGGTIAKYGNRLFTEGGAIRVREEQRIVPSHWGDSSKFQPPVARNSHTWSSAAIRLGLSFGIALVAAALLRAFLRTMLTLFIVVGVVLLLLYNHGVIDPFWEDYASAAGEAKVWAMEQKDHMQHFLKGYVPSAGAAMLGFAFGFLR